MKKLATILMAIALLALAASAASASNAVRISQIFGANSATNAYNADYIELFNDSGSPVNIGGWSLQYGGSTNTSGFQTSNVYAIPANTMIPACGYFLLQCATTATGLLPVTPDLYIGTAIDLNNKSGKIVLQNSTPQVLPCLGSGFTPPGGVTIEDLLGYGAGTGVCYETAAAPQEAGFVVLQRGSGGITDTDNNANDFTAVTVTAGQAVMHNSTMTNATCLATPTHKTSWGSLKSIYR